MMTDYELERSPAVAEGAADKNGGKVTAAEKDNVPEARDTSRESGPCGLPVKCVVQ